ncbi:hypothetical protein diail_709 [Diaporthe ilicicola]|nr:hypothetical protein diail_709 [Diaporthe ilicicola]
MTSTHRPKPLGNASTSLDLLTVTSTELQQLLSNGAITSVDLVDLYLDQIERENHQGLILNAINDFSHTQGHPTRDCSGSRQGEGAGFHSKPAAWDTYHNQGELSASERPL